ncbi:hypothetical protein PUN4_550104 [Paraburkholderia unamae]|nr:hypothetical protein PUN4_550104 [Paraburkholderia unamae]
MRAKSPPEAAGREFEERTDLPAHAPGYLFQFGGASKLHHFLWINFLLAATHGFLHCWGLSVRQHQYAAVGYMPERESCEIE